MANDLSAFDGQAWSKRLVTKLNQINVMLPLVNKDYEGELQNIGDTVQVRTPGNITMGAYTKGGTLSYQDLAPTKEAFTVSDAEYFAFLVDDIDKAQNDINAMDVYQERAVVTMNNVVEAKILSKYTGVLTANKLTVTSTGIAAGGGTPVVLTSEGANDSAYQAFVKARTALRKQEVPMAGLWAVIDPDTTALLLSDTKHFVRATEFGDRVVIDGRLGIEGIKGADGVTRPGFVGRCAGFDVYESTQVPTATVSSVPSKFLIFGDTKLITYASQISQIEALRLQTTFASAVRGLLLHDAKVFAECSKRGVTVCAAV